MRILVERSGGFAGIKKKASADSDTMSAEDAERFQTLVDAAGVLDLPVTPAAPSGGADSFQYRLTIETLEERRTVEVRDPGPALKRLIDWLWAPKS